MASELCGQAAFTERVRYHRWGQAQSEDRQVWHDVLTPDMIRQLPTGHALVVRANLSPVIARLGVAWKDRTYKAARRAGTAIAALSPAAPPLRLPTPQPATRPARTPRLTLIPGDAGAWPQDDDEGDATSRAFPWS